MFPSTVPSASWMTPWGGRWSSCDFSNARPCLDWETLRVLSQLLNAGSQQARGDVSGTDFGLSVSVHPLELVQQPNPTMPMAYKGIDSISTKDWLLSWLLSVRVAACSMAGSQCTLKQMPRDHGFPFYSSIFINMCVCACAHATVHVWRTEDKCGESVLSTVSPWGQTEVVSLGGKHLYLLNHLTSPKDSLLF